MAILKEVAEKAGVSIRTVTRALNGAPDINPATRDRIMQVASELRYRPHFAGRSLKMRKTMIVGILRCNTQVDPDNRRITLISERLSGHGYGILQGIYHDAPSRRNLISRFQDICDAIIFSPCGLKEEPADYRALQAEKYPFVLLDPHPDLQERFPSVNLDREKGVADAVRSLSRSGHIRVAFMTSILPLQNRIEGFRQGLHSLKREFTDKSIIPVRPQPGSPLQDSSALEYEKTMEAGYYTARTHEAIGRDFDALICYNDALALGCLRGLFERGLRVPQDISVIGFDNSIYTGYTHIPLSTVAQPISEPSEAVVQMVLDQLEGKAVTCSTFPTAFIERHSS